MRNGRIGEEKRRGWEGEEGEEENRRGGEEYSIRYSIII